MFASNANDEFRLIVVKKCNFLKILKNRDETRQRRLCLGSRLGLGWALSRSRLVKERSVSSRSRLVKPRRDRDISIGLGGVRDLREVPDSQNGAEFYSDWNLR